jgi:2'-5' RNA ligase
MVRIFLAIDLPSIQCDIIKKHQDQWKFTKADVKWVYSHNIHLTLKFLGEIQESSAESVISVCKDMCCLHESFSLFFKGTGIFPNLRRPRVLWVGVKGEIELLAKLQHTLDIALEKKGFSRESRTFIPHLTVGRIRSFHNLSRLLRVFLKDEVLVEPFMVKEVVVYKSQLTPDGPLHEPLARCQLI